jgi:hypothetical protein
MGAITSVGLTPDTFLGAFEAGQRSAAVFTNDSLLEDAYNRLLQAARKSAAIRRRVDESIARIMSLKDRSEFIPLRLTHSPESAHSPARSNKLRKSTVETVLMGVTV